MAPPITVSRFCLRVIAPSVNPSDAANACSCCRLFGCRRRVRRRRAPVRRAPRRSCRAPGIRTHEPLPAFRILRIFLQLFVEPATIVSIIALRSSGDICDAAAISSAPGPAGAGAGSGGHPAVRFGQCLVDRRQPRRAVGGRLARIAFQACDGLLDPALPAPARWPGRTAISDAAARASSARSKAACASAVIRPPAAAAIASPSPASRVAVAPSSRIALAVGRRSNRRSGPSGDRPAPARPSRGRHREIGARCASARAISSSTGCLAGSAASRAASGCDGSVGRSERGIEPPADQRHRQHRRRTHRLAPREDPARPPPSAGACIAGDLAGCGERSRRAPPRPRPRRSGRARHRGQVRKAGRDRLRGRARTAAPRSGDRRGDRHQHRQASRQR